MFLGTDFYEEKCKIKVVCYKDVYDTWNMYVLQG